ncbi:MAG: DUF2326 domain-containing protein, partial [Acetobacteraceae bacterium]|nr:DUF2326 domain-containing protein [Acetobacteraceae bacterium]
MIYSLSSDLPSFKGLAFQPGLNILLAEKSVGATDRQSRNGAGKTSLIELIHFLFGANADKDSIFRSDALARFSFGGRIDLGSTIVEVSRSGAKPPQICLLGDTLGWPIVPSVDARSGDLVISNEKWRVLLGALLFRLNSSLDDDSTVRFRPTFRPLFSYFVRRENSNGFILPTQYSSKQQPWDQQVAISYLLGLDSNVPQRFQEVRIRERAMVELRKAAKDGSLGGYFGTAADLRTRLTIADAKARRMREQIDTFNVVPEYSEMEQEGSRITREISTLSDDNTADRELILQLRAAIDSELPPATTSLDRLYREAGVVLPGSVGRRFDEVEEFHQAIVQNRRSHLTSEVQAADGRVQSRDRVRERLDGR